MNTKPRPARDVYFLQMAMLVATRSTCLRRAVGCVLVDTHGHVLATGYNGVAAGMPHCNEPTELYLDGTVKGYGNACKGAWEQSGASLDRCEAVHAEQNAILQCQDVLAIETCYTTASPCDSCSKLLLNTSCRRIVFAEEYPNPGARDRWLRAGRTLEHLQIILK